MTPTETRYVTELPSYASARYLAQHALAAGGRAELQPHMRNSVLLTLDEAGYQALRRLDPEDDGHVDDSGQLWIGDLNVAEFRQVTA